MLYRCPLMLYLFPMATSASFHGWLFSIPRLYETRSNWTVWARYGCYLPTLSEHSHDGPGRFLRGATATLQRIYEMGFRIVIYKVHRTVEAIPQTHRHHCPNYGI